MINIFHSKEPIKDANDLKERSWNKDIVIPTNTVVSIIDEIKKNGEDSLLKFAEKFDNVKLDSIIVSKDEIKDAYENVTSEQIQTIKFMKSKLEKSEQSLINNLGNIECVKNLLNKNTL